MNLLQRKQFITRSLLSAAGFFLAPTTLMAQDPNNEKGPVLPISDVKEFVLNAHKDFDKVKTMLKEKPDLLNAVNNLGGWDWEDAVSAAGHVGHVDMANYLLEKGAHMTICVAAMLGKTAIVKTTIETFPYMKDAVGPHKISLMRHAKAGGPGSVEVVEYLQSIGIKN